MSVFNLNTGDGNFKDRQKKVFDQLLVLENSRTSHTDQHTEAQPTSKRAQRHETKQFRRKESIFKKPQNPVFRNYFNKMPDFKKNPHKWTKYSLEDVQEMTDESNRKAAFDFLKQLADRQRNEEKLEELPSKIEFNKHVKICNTKEPIEKTPEDSEGATFKDSKLIMPEYVVGKKPTKTKRPKGVKPDKGVQLRLDHLDFEDE